MSDTFVSTIRKNRWVTNSRKNPECLTPRVRRSAGSVILWGMFCWHSFVSLAPKREESLQINAKLV